MAQCDVRRRIRARVSTSQIDGSGMSVSTFRDQESGGGYRLSLIHVTVRKKCWETCTSTGGEEEHAKNCFSKDVCTYYSTVVRIHHRTESEIKSNFQCNEFGSKYDRTPQTVPKLQDDIPTSRRSSVCYSTRIATFNIACRSELAAHHLYVRWRRTFSYDTVEQYS